MTKALRPLGLYLHIPFCRQKCSYCDFYSLPRQDPAVLDAYTAALCAHLSETAPLAQMHTVDTVYFGGGTPSLLGVERIKTILKTVQKHYHLAKSCEITLEANPESVGDSRSLRRLRRAGVNRISLGVQSADDRFLQALGRVHSFAQVQEAVAAIRKAKLKNLSLDLMYGLPEQTPEDWERSLEAALALEPEHLSCYGLKLEPNTPLAQQNGLSLPDDEQQAQMYLMAVEKLREHGYEQYEISNFARQGFASRHNLKYWRQQEYAGFGPGAHSDFGEVRYAYERDLTAYLRGELRLSESERLPMRERSAEYVMLALRTSEGLDPAYFERSFRLRFAPMLPVLEQCERAGYALETDGHWHLTPEGFLRSNPIILALQDALAEEAARREEARARGDFRIVP